MTHQILFFLIFFFYNNIFVFIQRGGRQKTPYEILAWKVEKKRKRKREKEEERKMEKIDFAWNAQYNIGKGAKIPGGYI